LVHAPSDAPLFCGSCFKTFFKTFVLATYLQEVEAGHLSESEQINIDDGIRSIGGEVFDLLTGTAGDVLSEPQLDRPRWQRDGGHRCL
jgi:hypothetical protein